VTLRLLANENVAGDVVDALRQTGCDVAWVRSDAPGSSDAVVLSRAVTERRIVLTGDKDFGDLAFHTGLPAGCGIILLRLPSSSPAALVTDVVGVLMSRTDWVGNFAVIEPHRIRMRPLPRHP
jgi:predicted nuclease of predicted toxin-antitoxin system